MKTTIDIPDDVLYRAKVAAAQRRTTLKDLVVRGLVAEISVADPDDSADALVAALSIGRNDRPVGRLNREAIYDRPALR